MIDVVTKWCSRHQIENDEPFELARKTRLQGSWYSSPDLIIACTAVCADSVSVI